MIIASLTSITYQWLRVKARLMEARAIRHTNSRGEYELKILCKLSVKQTTTHSEKRKFEI